MGGDGSNIPPSADAGDDQTVTDTDSDGEESVTLNGTDSYDPDGNGVSYQWTEGETVLGTAAILPWTFAVGAHTVTLTVTDDEDATDTDTVVVTVNVYTPPVAADDTYSVKKGQTLTVSAPGVLANDTDALTAAMVAGPSNGTIVAWGGDGSFTYTPNDGFTGKDSFTYYASDDGGGDSLTATVEINVKKNGKGPGGGGDGGDGGGGPNCDNKPAGHPHCP